MAGIDCDVPRRSERFWGLQFGSPQPRGRPLEVITSRLARWRLFAWTNDLRPLSFANGLSSNNLELVGKTVAARRSSFDEPRAYGDARQFHGAFAAEFLINSHAMGFDGFGADGELRCGLAR